MRAERDDSIVVEIPFKLVGEGYRLLSPSGCGPEIDAVSWADDLGSSVVVKFADGTELSVSGELLSHAVWHEDAHEVTAEHLAAAPTLPATSLGLGTRVGRAYAAYIDNDLPRVREYLAPLALEIFTGNHDHWSPIAQGLALLSFVEFQDGAVARSVELSKMLEVEARSVHEKIDRKILARKLSSPLPEAIDLKALSEVVYRWARGGSEAVNRVQLEGAHDQILAGLRARS